MLCVQVWTIDNRRQVYVRTGITDTMPIGTEWKHVPGNNALIVSVFLKKINLIK